MKRPTQQASAFGPPPAGQSPLGQLKGVGPKTEQCLKKLNIHSIQDLLFHLPLRYEDRTTVMPIGRARPGMRVMIEGKVEASGVVFRGRRELTVHLGDGTGFLTLRFFHFNIMQQQQLKRGGLLRCFGEVRFGKMGFEIIHPEYRMLDPDHPLPLETHLTAIYPTAEGLPQAKWRQMIRLALVLLSEQDTPELLPDTVLRQHRFPELKQAIYYLHQPPIEAEVSLLSEGKHPYQRRLIFEELLAHHLSLRALRQKSITHPSKSLASTHAYLPMFLKQLPFVLTGAQHRVIKAIEEDVKRQHPMLRLVQGDVGSGKTVVAAAASLLAIENQGQAALMAPTELLTEQHLENFKRWFEPLGIAVVGLTSQLTKKERKGVLEKIKSGEAKMIIGTHALFQKDVEFHELDLLIIDEQHRFGVHQRLALHEKGRQGKRYPHQLVMTATPIPRTLAMLAYADLDYAVIDEMPANRLPVRTGVINNDRRPEMVERVLQFCLGGRQVYWVCPLIEESELLQCQAAEQTELDLRKALPDLKIALIHGRMKSDDRDHVMREFKAGRYHVLVATTVIEVGVDIPNACLMVIENAERLGLAQLHQLRGRVGRGPKESHCLLLYQKPLSKKARERLAILRRTQDGFLVAQKDLELRGPGEILGLRQSGLMQLKIADLIRDRALLPSVMEASSLVQRENPELIPKLIERWINRAEEYGRV